MTTAVSLGDAIGLQRSVGGIDILPCLQFKPDTLRKLPSPPCHPHPAQKILTPALPGQARAPAPRPGQAAPSAPLHCACCALLGSSGLGCLSCRHARVEAEAGLLGLGGVHAGGDHDLQWGRGGWQACGNTSAQQTGAQGGCCEEVCRGLGVQRPAVVIPQESAAKGHAQGEQQGCELGDENVCAEGGQASRRQCRTGQQAGHCS